MEKKISFVTNNIHKVMEVQSLLPNWKFEHANFALREIMSLEPSEVVSDKLFEAAKIVKPPLIVEKTCLRLSCLEGHLPGPFTQVFAQALGKHGIAEFVGKSGDDRARVVTVLGYYDGSDIRLFQGEISGKIVPPKGDGGFSWDLIFQPDGYYKTFGEMGTLEKNRISHRKIACERLGEFLRSIG